MTPLDLIGIGIALALAGAVLIRLARSKHLALARYAGLYRAEHERLTAEIAEAKRRKRRWSHLQERLWALEAAFEAGEPMPLMTGEHHG